MKPVRFRPLTSVSRILCIPLFVAFLLLANGASVSANVAASQGPRSLQSNVSNHAIKPNVYTACPPPFITPKTCVPTDGQVSEPGAVVAGATIAADPGLSTDLVSGGRDANCPAPFSSPGDASFYSSTNGGVSWSVPYCMPSIDGGTQGGAPGAAFDLTHNSYIAADESGTSPDGTDIFVESSSGCSGPPWCTPVTIAPHFAGGSIDQFNMQVDDHSVSPYLNCIYAAARQGDSTSTHLSITVSYLCPPYTWGSNTFTTTVVTTVNYPATTVVSPSLTIGTNGTVYVTWLQCNPFSSDHHCGKGTSSTLWISKSTNHGATWSAPILITNVTLVPDTCSHSLGCIPGTSDQLADGPSVGIGFKNKLYVTYYTYIGSQLQVKVRTSINGGATWSAAVRVNPTDTNDEFLPWLSVNPATGTVGVTWLELYTSGPNAGMYQEYGALEKFNSPIWAVSPPLSSALSNPNNTGWYNPYLGDYMDNIWVQTGSVYTLYAVWTDNRAQDQVYVGGIISRY
ncbi:MAG: sialidase family protein [Ktedonobacteraceae bacterium]